MDFSKKINICILILILALFSQLAFLNNGVEYFLYAQAGYKSVSALTYAPQSSNDLYLLAKCVHAEARGEPYVGQVAVAAVILNRVEDPNFPNSIYGVVYQPWAFTAVNDGQIDLEPNSTAYKAAQDALNGWDPTYGCIYYYNPSTATSQWIFSREVVLVIGEHAFAR